MLYLSYQTSTPEPIKVILCTHMAYTMKLWIQSFPQRQNLITEVELQFVEGFRQTHIREVEAHWPASDKNSNKKLTKILKRLYTILNKLLYYFNTRLF
jgi:hypothetical protein